MKVGRNNQSIDLVEKRFSYYFAIDACPSEIVHESRIFWFSNFLLARVSVKLDRVWFYDGFRIFGGTLDEFDETIDENGGNSIAEIPTLSTIQKVKNNIQYSIGFVDPCFYVQKKYVAERSHILVN